MTNRTFRFGRSSKLRWLVATTVIAKQAQHDFTYRAIAPTQRITGNNGTRRLRLYLALASVIGAGLAFRVGYADQDGFPSLIFLLLPFAMLMGASVLVALGVISSTAPTYVKCLFALIVSSLIVPVAAFAIWFFTIRVLG